VRIAILGGTFDPVHNGHLAAAQSVASCFQTEQTHFVPAYAAPHKQSQDATSPFHRFAMVALAIAPFSGFRTSTIEVDAMEKRYTVETLELLQRANPDARLIFVLGTDMYQEFDTWKNPQRILELAHLAVVSRPGYPFREDLGPYRALGENERVNLPEKPAVFFLPFVVQPISSSRIRESCRKGSDVRQSLPLSVWNYIERHQLYS
jgi:nicotinate-nucleotide adenylyltransferase